MPTGYYGLELVTDYPDYIRKIQVQVNDTIRHLFRMPSRLALKAMLAELGVCPVAIQGRYLQRRRYARMISLGYCVDFPWCGSVRSDWREELMEEEPPVIEGVVDVRPLVVRLANRQEAVAFHDKVVGRMEDDDVLVLYSDGSSTKGHSGGAYVLYERGLVCEEVGFGLPREWGALEEGSGVDTGGCWRGSLGVRNSMLARVLRKKEWDAWHREEGHDYYRRMPQRPVHLKGLLRWDLYILIRLRTGTGIHSGPHACVDEDDRFHLTCCHLTAEGRPEWRHLFDDKHVLDWVVWWQVHACLGFTLARHRSNIAGVRVVGGNLFSSQLLLTLGEDEWLVPGGAIKRAVL
ncbi:hypothetical protein HOY82DRAFT_600244 [Tuber indicum]|nr:hypothetical protein HOY82DRAFT_600244 [Tuber indicum]